MQPTVVPLLDTAESLGFISFRIAEGGVVLSSWPDMLCLTEAPKSNCGNLVLKNEDFCGNGNMGRDSLAHTFPGRILRKSAGTFSCHRGGVPQDCEL